MSKGDENVVATTYLHVGNSGLTVKVVDVGWGPTLVVESSSFGNLNNSTRTHTSVEGLRAIRDMLDRAIEHEGYSEEYCHAAKAPGHTGGECCMFGSRVASWPNDVPSDDEDEDEDEARTRGDI